MRELTLELTNYCPRGCEFCSSNATARASEASRLRFFAALEVIKETDAEVIHLSGGEPLAHPKFYEILRAAQERVGEANVRVQSCAVRWLAYNLQAVPDVRVEAYATPRRVDLLRVVKRINQGREAKRPDVRFSRNWTGECSEPGSCGHVLVRPDGTVVRGPCAKEGVR